MGEQRRSDTDRQTKDPARQKDAGAVHAGAGADHEEHGAFDTSHARAQYRMTSGNAPQRYEWGIDAGSVPDRAVAAVGKPEDLAAKLDTAIAKQDAQAIHQIVTDMDRDNRIAAATRLSEMTFLSPREVAFVGEMGFASIDDILVAMCDAGAKPAELRALVADIYPTALWQSLGDAGIAKLRAKLPSATPQQIFPQINESEGFAALSVVRWYLEVTPLELVARHMLAATTDGAWSRAFALQQIGPSAWKWLAKVDAKLAAAAMPGVLDAYRSIATVQSEEAKDANGGKPNATSEVLDLIAADVATKSQQGDDYRAAHPAAPADLRRDKKMVLAHSVLEIERETRLAGLPVSEQLEWVLDKPGVTLDDVRTVTLFWERDTKGLADPKVVQRIRAKFPKAHAEDVYGFVPSELYTAAFKDATLRAWLVDGAQPAEILRFVTFDPNRVLELCRWLVSHGTGYHWVYELGGHYNDMALRIFALGVPDATVATYVKTRLLGDAVTKEGTSEGLKPIGKDAYDSSGQHLDKDLTSRQQPLPWPTSPETIEADIEKLDGAEAAAIRKDPAKVRQILAQSTAATIVRVLEKLDPVLRDVLNFAPALPLGQFLPWGQSRSEPEVAEALAHHVGGARARTLLSLGAIEAFPQLADAKVLRQVLMQNPEVVAWILAGEPQTALIALGNAGVVDAAAKALDGNEDAIEVLPPGQAMGGMARIALQELARHTKGPLRQTIDTKLGEKAASKGADAEDVSGAEKGVQAMRSLDMKGADFVEQLRGALETEGVSPETVIQMCRRAAPADVKRVIKDTPTVRWLASTNLAPTTLFPGHTLAEFAVTEACRAWMLKTVSPGQLLADPTIDVLTAISEQLNRSDDWLLATFPPGAALRPVEKASLFQLAKLAGRATLYQLFKVRFNTPPGGGSVEDLLDLWGVLDRLPDSHVTERTISRFQHIDVPPTNGTGGAYYPDDMHIDVRAGLGKGGIRSPEYDRSGPSAEMTEAEAVEALGTRAAFEQFKTEHRLLPIGDTGKYRFAEQTPKPLDLTVLHEVGHAVDARVGGHTELVYGLAGWKVYAEAEFDKWAEELGGWGDVEARDQAKIREIWMTWLSSSHGIVASKSVGEMVPKDHPAIADRYTNVGVVKLARDHEKVSYLDPAVVGSRAAIANFGGQQFMTLSSRGMHAAPSQYALSAPAEYFAECYANYYREVDGTPETAKLKGKSLAPWIKQWFDANIDNLGHMPRR